MTYLEAIIINRSVETALSFGTSITAHAKDCLIEEGYPWTEEHEGYALAVALEIDEEWRRECNND